MKLILISFLIWGCSQLPEKGVDEELVVKTSPISSEVAETKAQALLGQMTTEEKKQVVSSFLTVKDLSSKQFSPSQPHETFFPGIERLGLPSIELMKETTEVSEERPGKVLRIGSVNLIRNFEKEQTYGNFEKASAVDQLMGPQKKNKKVKLEGGSYKLEDLDLFLVKSGSEERLVQDYICALYKENQTTYVCAEGKFEDTISKLNLSRPISELLRKDQLGEQDLNTVVTTMLTTMYQLKIIQ